MKLPVKLSILQFLQDNTFQTGSLAFGLSNPKDDDRFCSMTALAKLGKVLEENAVTTSVENADEYSSSQRRIVFALDGVRYDVFAVPDDQIGIMQTTTDMLTVAAGALPTAARIKPLRVALFRTIRDALVMWRDVEKGYTL